MAWSLQIWFIDVVGSGDSTLIVATDDGVGAGHVAQVRSVLIDGGRNGHSLSVHDRIVNVGVNPLNVMVATHYDDDHVGGLTALLNGGNAIYNTTRIYDQGEQGTVTATAIKRRKTSGVAASNIVNVTIANREQNYQSFLNATVAHGARVRVTDKVLSQQNPDQNLQTDGWTDPDWLVGQEILWNGVAGGVPVGAPRLQCIAANQYLQQVAPAGPRYVSTSVLTGDRLKNEKSLAFLLTFGNFKYYAGGDIESSQEDGSAWNGAGYSVTQNARNLSLMRMLNPTNDPAGRVHAMKTSHHGSKYSTSPAFLARLRAVVAIISCGTDNQYGHPDQEVVDTLQASNTILNYFLTGEKLAADSTNLSAKATVTGARPPAPPWHVGDIQLTVTAAQAASTPAHFTVECYEPIAGTNRQKLPGFAYTPGAAFQYQY